MSEMVKYVSGSVIYVAGGVLYGLFIVDTGTKALTAVILGLVFGAFFLTVALSLNRLKKKEGKSARRLWQLIWAVFFSVTITLMHYAFTPEYERSMRSVIIFGILSFILGLFVINIDKKKKRLDNDKK